MPMIPRYPAPTVQAAAPFLPTEGIPVSPDAFGASLGAAQARQGAMIGAAAEQSAATMGDADARLAKAQQSEGEAVGKFGEAIGKAGDVLNKQVLSLAEMNNVATVQDALAKQYLPALGKIEGDFYSLKLGQAKDAYPAALESLSKLRDETGSSFANPEQKKLFNEFAIKHLNSSIISMARHAEKETVNYQDQSHAALIGAFVDDAVRTWTDPGRADQSITAAVGSVRAYAAERGWSPEMTDNAVRDVTSKSRAGIAQQIFATGDAMGALGYVQNHLDQLSGHDQYNLTTHFRPHAESQLAQNIADFAVGRKPYSGELNDLQHQIATAAQGAGIDPAHALTVAHIETTTGKGDLGSIGNLFQVKGGTTDPNDTAGQIGDGINALKAAEANADKALGRKSEPWERYLVFQQGSGGGPALLTADPEAKAVDVLRKFYSPAKAQEAIVKNGGNANMTVGDFLQTWKEKYSEKAAEAGVVGRPVLTGVPDLDAMMARGEALVTTAGASRAVRDKVRSMVQTEYNRQNAALASERADALAGAQDAIAAASAGRDVAFDRARLLRLMPDQAGAVIDQFDRARASGQALNAIRYATPAEIAAQRAQNAAALSNPTAEDFKEKAGYVSAWEHAAAMRDKALNDDPAGFVSGSPAVKPLLAAIDPANSGPGTVAYVRASLAEQARLGVPAEDQRVLSPGQADDMVRKLTKTPPGETDIGAAMGKLFDNYGRYGHQVFGELVKAKLPGDYQVLATMDAPGQVAARADLQKVLILEAEKGGAEKIKQAAPKHEVEKIDKRLDDALAPFRATTVYNDGGMALFGTVKDAVRKLAYGYAYRGQDGDIALDNAVNGILGAKYDFEDGMPAPKGAMSAVKQAAFMVLNKLRPAEIAPVPGNPELPLERRQQIVIDAARNGRWVPNSDYSGLVLMAKYRDGQFLPLKRANGSLVGFSFHDAPGLAATIDNSGPDLYFGGP